jgi:hypothetical protein
VLKLKEAMSGTSDLFSENAIQDRERIARAGQLAAAPAHVISGQPLI